MFRDDTESYGHPYLLTIRNRPPKWTTRNLKRFGRLAEIELKTIAGIGSIGLQNAGKSTLLRAISNAYSKQRIHVFTTSHPFVDKIDCANQHQVTLAGDFNFIESAHRNMSLAHTFLRHVERAKLLIYVIDISGPSPFDILKTLQQELKTYKPGLIKIQSLAILIRLQLKKT